MSNYVIIDAANLFHRCKHVTMGDAATKAGYALHICFNAIKSAWKKFQGDHVVLCLEGSSWRKEVYPDYKAHRRVQEALKTRAERADDELYFGAMTAFCDFLAKRTNVTVLQSGGCEADDLIARWIDLHPSDNHVIVSGDSDFYQLLAPNVRIYDGVKSWTISLTEVLDEKDNPATVKRTLTSKNEKGKTVKTTITEAVEPPDPEYELFKKIIRGDASDNIMSANPGVREKGSSKKPGILEAYNDRKGRGFDWNNFMLQTWIDHDGNTVRVLDAYKRNQQLIDLRAQPEEIKDLLDATIVEAIQQPLKPGVGIWFLKFCDEMNLVNIAKHPNDFAAFLAAPYSKA